MARELTSVQQRQLVAFRKLHPEAQAIPGEGFLAICTSHDSKTGEVVAYHVAKYHPWGAIAGHVTAEDMTRERAEGALISETIQALVVQRDQLKGKLDSFTDNPPPTGDEVKMLRDTLEAITHRLDLLGVEAEAGLEAAVPDVL